MKRVLMSGSASLLLACAAHAEDVFYLNIPGITGDVVAQGYQGWITVTSFAEGFSGADSGSGAGTGNSRASCQEFKIVKPLDVTSPQIALAVVRNEIFGPIQLAVVQSGKFQAQYLTFTLSNAVISAVQFGGDETTSARVETLKITPAKVTIKYTPQEASGIQGQPVLSTVNCSRN